MRREHKEEPNTAEPAKATSSVHHAKEQHGFGQHSANERVLTQSLAYRSVPTAPASMSLIQLNSESSPRAQERRKHATEQMLKDQAAKAEAKAAAAAQEKEAEAVLRRTLEKVSDESFLLETSKKGEAPEKAKCTPEKLLAYQKRVAAQLKNPAGAVADSKDISQDPCAAVENKIQGDLVPSSPTNNSHGVYEAPANPVGMVASKADASPSAKLPFSLRQLFLYVTVGLPLIGIIAILGVHAAQEIRAKLSRRAIAREVVGDIAKGAIPEQPRQADEVVKSAGGSGST